MLVILCIAILPVNTIQAQTCPQPITTTITSNANTYYPGLQEIVSAGSTSVAIAAATYGTIPISAGDVLLIIQMTSKPCRPVYTLCKPTMALVTAMENW